MHPDLERLVHPRPQQAESQVHLVACSLCLGVWRDSSWVPPESVIRELRSYELTEPLRLDWTMCDHCSHAIFGRRARLDVPSAA